MTKCANILEAYLDNIFVRCDYTAISSIAHNICEACLSFSIFYVFTSVYERIDTPNLIIKGVLSSPWKSFKIENILFCNYLKIPVFFNAPTLTVGNVWFINNSIASVLCLIFSWSFLNRLNTLPNTKRAKVLSLFA